MRKGGTSRAIALAVCLAMAAPGSMIPVQAAAQTENVQSGDGLITPFEQDSVKTDGTYEAEDGVSYTYQSNADGGITITGLTSLTQRKSLVIPSEIDGLAVTEIGDSAFASNQYIEGVTIPDSVTRIGEKAFFSCKNMVADIVIPGSVTEIGVSAFSGCRKTAGETNITISNKIGTQMTNAKINIGNLAFAYNSGIKGTLTIERPCVIGESAFSGCTYMTGGLSLPEGTTEIGASAFYNCSALDGELSLPDSVTGIGEKAFYNCSKLTTASTAEGDCTFSIPSEIKEISNNAFYGCSGLTGELKLPSGIETIGDGAFYDCSGLTGDLILADTITSIGASAFAGCKNLDGKLVLPASITSIPNYAFNECTKLTGDTVTVDGKQVSRLVIPESVTSIGTSAFAGCVSLTGDINIPDKVTTIGEAAFKNCTGFDGTLTLPSRITAVNKETFCGCSGLTGKLDIPVGVTSVGVSAFSGCTGLGLASGEQDLVLPEGLLTIDQSAFMDCSGFSGELHIPATVKTVGISAFEGCSGFTGDLILQKSITKLGASAFKGCSGFTGDLVLTLSVNVSTLDTSVFDGCSGLGTDEGTGDVVITSGIKKIKSRAFADCSNIKSFKIAHVLSKNTSTGLADVAEDAFSGCSADLKFKIETDSLMYEWLKNYYPDTYQDMIQEPVLMTSLAIYHDGKDVESVTVVEGDTIQLTAVCEPDNLENGSVEWTLGTSQGTYASVDSTGLVTAKKAGTITVKAAATDGSGVSDTCSVVITAAPKLSIGDAEVTLDKTEFEYTGSAIKPVPTVKYNGTVLEENYDYTLSYKNYVNVGTGQIVITGTGDYAGTKTVTYEIIEKKTEATTEATTETTTEVTTEATTEATTETTTETTTEATTGSTTETTTEVTTGSTTETTTEATTEATTGSTTETTTEATTGSTTETTTEATTGSTTETTTEATTGSTTETTTEATTGSTTETTTEITTGSTTETTTEATTGSATEITTESTTGEGTTASEDKTTEGTTSEETTDPDDPDDPTDPDQPVRVNSIKLSPDISETSIDVGNTLTFTAIVGPENAANKQVVWSSTKPEFAEVDAQGKVTAKAAGTTVIRVEATDGSNVFAQCIVTVTEPFVLNTPSISSLTNTASGVKITWKKVADAKGYIIYRKKSGDSDYETLKKVSGGSTVSYVDKSAVSGKTYYYKVAAYSGDTRSSQSVNRKVTYVGTTTISGAVNASNGITLTWKRVSGATKYEIYRKASGASKYSRVKTITSGSTVKWTDTRAAGNGKTYQYYIVACKGSVKGANSSSIKAVFVSRPTLSKLTEKTGGKMLVQWKKNSSASGYQIQYGIGSSMSGAKTVSVSSRNTVSKVLSGLNKNKKYYVKIRTYKTVSGKKYYSAWSTAKSLKITK
ncbi:MAG: leucine-rich repeat protein [Wujia sp.]